MTESRISIGSGLILKVKLATAESVRYLTYIHEYILIPRRDMASR